MMIGSPKKAGVAVRRYAAAVSDGPVHRAVRVGVAFPRDVGPTSIAGHPTPVALVFNIHICPDEISAVDDFSELFSDGMGIELSPPLAKSIANPSQIQGVEAMGNLDPRVTEILAFLNHAQIRATYGAVAPILGVIPQSVGARLGIRRSGASWVVSAKNGFPTGYTSDLMATNLTATSAIIRTTAELKRRMAEWRQNVPDRGGSGGSVIVTG
jgi:hypothetical protein